MDFALTDDQRAIDESVRRVTARFGDEYWLARDRDGAFPHEYRRAVAGGAGSASRCRPSTAAAGSGSRRRR